MSLLTRTLVASIGILVPVAVSAQQVSSFEDVPDVVTPHQRVLLRDVDGRAFRGNVVQMNASSITLRFRDDDGLERTRVFERNMVVEIRRTDRLWNGLFIGLGAGVVSAEVFVRNVCGPRGYDSECSAIASVVGWSTFVPGGAVLGALVDKAIGNQLIYRRGRSDVTLSVAPILSPTANGLRALIRF